MRITPNAFMRPKYIGCSAKHISDRVKIWIRRSSIFLKASRSREQKAKCFELRLCLSIYDLYDLKQNTDNSHNDSARSTNLLPRDLTPRISSEKDKKSWKKQIVLVLLARTNVCFFRKVRHRTSDRHLTPFNVHFAVARSILGSNSRLLIFHGNMQ